MSEVARSLAVTDRPAAQVEDGGAVASDEAFGGVEVALLGALDQVLAGKAASPAGTSIVIPRARAAAKVTEKKFSDWDAKSLPATCICVYRGPTGSASCFTG